MKKYGMSIVSAMLGSIFTFGIIATYSNYKSNHTASNFWPTESIPVKNASFNSQSGSSGSYPDFTEPAAKVMDAVVHIKSKQIIKRQAPQGNYFIPGMPDDLFQQFFGNPYGGRGQQQQQLPDQEQIGTGSGVIIKADGYIVTNNHVIDNADEIEVTLHDNRTFKATVVGTDVSTDLALLKIEASDLKFIPLANSDDVKVGQWVLAVGNPFNLNSTVTAGIVSAKGRNININKDKYAIESFIQTDAAINPGNSGGALCNLDGELVGINTAIASPTGAYSGYGFAIPANIVRKVIGDIIEFGTVQRAFLGVSIRDVNSELAKQKGINLSEGIYIEGMTENSAAKKAGIKVGDVITSIDGIKVNTTPELQEVIGKHKPGDAVQIKINRDGNESIIAVTLTGQNGTTATVTRDEGDILKSLGIAIETISPEQIKKLNIAGGIKVTQISEGIISKSTDMKVGCIIVKVDRQQIKDKEQFINLMKTKNGGVLMECLYEKSNAHYYSGFGL